MDDLSTIFDYQQSGLPYPGRKEGNKENVQPPPILLCLAGFPDASSVFTPMTLHAELQTTHHIIALALPGMQQDSLPATKKWGYTFYEIQAELHKVVSHLHRQSNSNNTATIHLCGHDWGAQHGFSYLQEHPDLISKYVSLDIGLFKINEISIGNNLRITAYFALFGIVFLVATLINKSLAAWLLDIFPWGTIGPLNVQDTNLFLVRPKQAPHTTYPYFQLIKDQICQFRINPLEVSWSRIEGVPQLFLFGKDKQAMYHSSVFLDNLTKTPGCEWKAIEGGHWFFTEPKQSQKVAKFLGDFLLS